MSELILFMTLQDNSIASIASKIVVKAQIRDFIVLINHSSIEIVNASFNFLTSFKRIIFLMANISYGSNNFQNKRPCLAEMLI